MICTLIELENYLYREATGPKMQCFLNMTYMSSLQAGEYAAAWSKMTNAVGGPAHKG